MMRLQLAAVSDHDRLKGAILLVARAALDLGDDVHALDDLAEDDVLVV